MAKEPFWEHPAEQDSRKKHMSAKQVKSAKASARAHGRPWPNLVDNVTAMRTGHKKGR